MIISIIGAGALGKTYGGLLAPHHDVHYLLRSEYAQIHRQQAFDLYFKDQDKQLTIEHPKLHQTAQTLPPSDLVIITAKSTENAQIASLLTSCLAEKSVVLIIQNGIGNEEWISQFTQGCQVVCGVSTMGAHRIEGCAVEIEYIGELRVAPFKTADRTGCDFIQTAFQGSMPQVPVRFFDNYKEIRWRKLMWNVPFSSLAIIYQQDTQKLATNQPFVSIVQSLMRELQDVAKADGVILTQEYIFKMLDATRTAGSYYPSMYYDYVQGKPIEKEYIIDNVLRVARVYQLNTPMLNLIESHLRK